MQFAPILFLVAAYTAVVQANDHFYGYTCYGCDCNAFESTSSEGNCIELSQGAAAWGISTGAYSGTYCTLFSESGCQGETQNVGHKSGQTWGCTNSQIGWVYSVLCES
ncbi:hypothetical protein MMC19_001866 [Ptychographa xylographoides]|nr:hypothetical protein [Ptychographa xylographoides]